MGAVVTVLLDTVRLPALLLATLERVQEVKTVRKMDWRGFKGVCRQSGGINPPDPDNGLKP